METGEKTKFDICLEIVSLLLLIGSIYRHKTIFIAFSNQIDLYIHLKCGHSEVVRVLTKLIEFQKKSHLEKKTSTNYTSLVHFVERNIKKRGIVFLLSDFLGLEDLSLLKRWRRKFKLNLLEIFDSFERELSLDKNPRGSLLLRDPESRKRVLSTTLEKFPRKLDMKNEFPLENIQINTNDFNIRKFIDYMNQKKNYNMI